MSQVSLRVRSGLLHSCSSAPRHATVLPPAAQACGHEPGRTPWPGLGWGAASSTVVTLLVTAQLPFLGLASIVMLFLLAALVSCEAQVLTHRQLPRDCTAPGVSTQCFSFA